jgi:hypothetical protein
LRSAGLDDAAILERLCESGFAREEALVAVRALPEKVARPDRATEEERLRGLRDDAYMLVLISSLLLAGGALLALTLAPTLGAALLVVGLGLLTTGWWKWWKGSV